MGTTGPADWEHVIEKDRDEGCPIGEAVALSLGLVVATRHVDRTRLSRSLCRLGIVPSWTWHGGQLESQIPNPLVWRVVEVRSWEF